MFRGKPKADASKTSAEIQPQKGARWAQKMGTIQSTCPGERKTDYQSDEEKSNREGAKLHGWHSPDKWIFTVSASRLYAFAVQKTLFRQCFAALPPYCRAPGETIGLFAMDAVIHSIAAS